MNMKKKILLPAALVAAMACIAMFAPGKAMAQECMMAEVRMFAGNFAPRAWAFAEGQLLPISQYSALFSLLGTTYGGDGRTTFALPDLRGRAPIGAGNGPGLSDRRLGQRGGTETSTLNVANMPSHNHTSSISVPADSGQGSQASPAGGVPAAGRNFYSPSANADTNLSAAVTVNNNGGSQPVNNMQPWLGMSYIICLQGIYPSR